MIRCIFDQRKLNPRQYYGLPHLMLKTAINIKHNINISNLSKLVPF